MFLRNLYFYFDELSWKIRINIIIILLFFKPNHKKIFQDLKNHGVAVVNGYFSNEDISNILSLCEEEINKLETFFDRAMHAGTDDYNVDQLKMLLTEGRQTLFVFTEGEKIIGALSAEVISYPNNRVVHTSAVGGKGIFD